jgi:hypothetical protein
VRNDISDEIAAQDINYWYMKHSERCPNCGIDLRTLHPQANLAPHWQGDCKVSLNITADQ